MKIGFIGQGFVGKNIANEFAGRGHEIVRYSLEKEYISNKEAISSCDIVFVAVPTPTTLDRFVSVHVEDAITLTSVNSIVVIKSTVLPGTTKRIQSSYSDRTILFSPEFLSEKTAANDVVNPILNIVGHHGGDSLEAAKTVLALLPKCDQNFLVDATEAELFKYAHNLQGYFRVMLSNVLYDVGNTFDINWDNVKPIMAVDPMMSDYYNQPVHQGGRGAGGACFIKDMAAFRGLYEELLPHNFTQISLLRSLEDMNNHLLKETDKSKEIMESVYGKK